jgi:hypothetical protein
VEKFSHFFALHSHRASLLWPFFIIFILDQISMKILGFFGEDHWPIKPYYMQVYVNSYLDLSTFQFKYYFFDQLST